MYTVYMHTDPDNKRYVGATKRSAPERWCYGSGYATNPGFSAAIKKHGWNNIKHEILSTCEARKEAIALEKYYVALYKTNDKRFGYNRTLGGEVQSDIVSLSGLGYNICLLRKIKRWTQADLAKSVQCSRMTIANWESGKTTPSRYGKAKLAHVLGVTVEELEGGAK